MKLQTSYPNIPQDVMKEIIRHPFGRIWSSIHVLMVGIYDVVHMIVHGDLKDILQLYAAELMEIKIYSMTFMR